MYISGVYFLVQFRCISPVKRCSQVCILSLGVGILTLIKVAVAKQQEKLCSRPEILLQEFHADTITLWSFEWLETSLLGRPVCVCPLYLR